MTQTSGELCTQCGHVFDNHAMLAFTDPLDGGVMLCPVHGCQCVSTWSVPQIGRPAPELPSPEDLAVLRAEVQRMSVPPVDHGSDRFGYVEIDAPDDIEPSGEWWDALIANPCPDCNANVFATFMHNEAKRHMAGLRHAWAIKIAHDDTCPRLRKDGSTHG